MKLYTEEQIRKFLTTKQSFITLDDMENLEYIELPSDEEIDKNGYHSEEYNEVWIGGANYVLNKIKEGNK